MQGDIQKLKRVNLTSEEYGIAVKIGGGVDTKECKAADIGVRKALQYFIESEGADISLYKKLSKLADIDASILGNLEIIYILGKNESIPADQINQEILLALKGISAKIINGLIPSEQ